MAALGFDDDPAEFYARYLREAGVDLEPLHERAQARLDRLSETRQQLVGRDWEVQQ